MTLVVAVEVIIVAKVIAILIIITIIRRKTTMPLIPIPVNKNKITLPRPQSLYQNHNPFQKTYAYLQTLATLKKLPPTHPRQAGVLAS